MTEGLPDDLEAVIGLEIHVQLATETKMFCGCRLSFGDPPNSHTCPVCLAHPGVLPVPNRRAIEFALQIALATECEGDLEGELDRPRTRLRGRAPFDLPPQELLLP